MILEFDIAALIIYALIILVIIRRRMYHGRTNRLYIMLVIISIVVTLTDALPYILFKLPLSNNAYIVYSGLFYMYFFLRNATIFVYLLFCMSSTRMWYRLHSIFMKIVFVGPYVFTVLVVFSNLFHNRLFTLTRDRGYARGELMIVLYMISGLYLLYIIIFLMYCRKKKFLETDRWIAFSSLILFSAVAVVIQMVRSEYLVEMFFTALALLSILFFIQKPEDYVDYVNGVMSFGLYQREVRKVINTGERAQIFVVNFRNANAVRQFLGEHDYDAQIMRILLSIYSLFKSIGHEFDIFYEEPGYIYIVMDNSNEILSDDRVVELTRHILTDAVLDERKGLTLDAVMTMLFAPDDLADEESIIGFGHRFTLFLLPGHHLLRASDVVGTKDFHIFNRMDEILRRAIADGSFEMHYQPIYSIKENRFISAEALIRLRDPDYGLISPALFIPEAERRHLMQAIGVHVLHDVIKFIGSADFKTLGLNYIELNLSVQQCVDKNIVDDIISYQKKYGVRPEQINLEITETDYADDTRNLDLNLHELADAGFALSLDDYGTGYSNMQRILHLPLNIIKIDKSMVDEMDTKKGKVLVMDTIRLMQDIGMEIVAEGVEKKEQLDMLASMGCDFIQGYYFSKPLPQRDFVEFIKKKLAEAEVVA